MALRANVTAEVDPISRIEGHLGVKVTTDATGHITDAEAHGNLWRGFENFLLGRDINDAITYVQRICGVCPVPHGMTSTYAVDTVLGYSDGHITFKTSGTKGVPAKAVLIRNLVLAAEFLMSSITHFYHLAAPSYVQGPAIPPWTPYFDDTYYHAALRSGGTAVPKAPGDPTMTVWDAVILSYVKALKVRRMTFEAGALFAGRMPMTSCYIGGGVTTEGTADLTSRCNKFQEIMQAVADFIIKEYVPIALVLGALYPDYDNTNNGGAGYGAGLGRYLAWGAFPNLDDTLALPGGLSGGTNDFLAANKAQVASQFLTGANSVPTNLLEDISHSRYGIATADAAAYAAHGNNAAYPGAVTRTKPNRATGYTYMKAPRWNGQACEVGPLARLRVAGFIQNNVAYATSASSAALTAYAGHAIAGYDAYVDAGALDTSMVGGDIVTALSNAGLVATVQTWILGLKGGASTMDRIRARALESVYLVQKMTGGIGKGAIVGGNRTLTFDAANGWCSQLAGLADGAGTTWTNKSIPTGTFQGWGATEAPRGALMHQAKITNGKIVAYQCIVPTTWNGSPKDASNNHGAIEAAMIGAPFSDAGASFDPNDFDAARTSTTITSQGGVEVLRIAQSFDPCIACAVH
ncbi:MAG: nickel-dependent hydrogenase large subunit [Coriobacteriales bacterium]|nr:nickel-dependent hydrogenase large subunit [Coriobacteriales bacterium]